MPAPPRWRSLPRRPAGPAAVCMPLRHLGCDRSLVCRSVAAGRGGSSAGRGRVACGALRAALADRKLRVNWWVLARSACSPSPYCRCTASARRRRRLAQLAHSLPCCCRATGRLRAGAAASQSFRSLDHGFMARQHARLQRACCPAALILLLAAAAATAQASGSPGKVAACGLLILLASESAGAASCMLVWPCQSFYLPATPPPLLLPLLQQSNRPVFTGVPTRIADGDTLTLPGGTRIRFFGIDAPESDQTCKDAQGATWACGACCANLARCTCGASLRPSQQHAA